MSRYLRPDRVCIQWLLVTVCRLLTGIRATWLAPPLPHQPTIYYANHSSHLDGLVIWASLPPEIRRRVHPVAAADYWLKTPLRRYLASSIFNAVLVERHGKSRDDAPRDPLEPLAGALERGESLIFFPEGTRGDGETPGEFKSGLYHLAQRCPTAVLTPVWLENLNRVLPKGSRLVVPVICRATFGESVAHPDEDETKKDFLLRARTALENLSS
ncbi:lysophospholipid acyltransferase family protein [Entomohabitans teleogrylli]|uniref:lysophospholipid acyltransferase family protein n=1 Tax=Entomohabitans teleogrylli TaxID=1384589 RepID=UPI00073D87EB|nr:lysophospholipid acyltransferase family protein [Entomohabitans teleogrylli]